MNHIFFKLIKILRKHLKKGGDINDRKEKSLWLWLSFPEKEGVQENGSGGN